MNIEALNNSLEFSEILMTHNVMKKVFNRME